MALADQIATLATRIATEFKSVRSTDLGGLKFVKLTQAAYTALGTKDANTVYFIVG